MGTVDTLRDMIVEEFKLDPAAIHADTDLESLGIDSLSIIEFVFKVEERFKVVLPDPRTQRPVEGAPAKRLWTLGSIAVELDALVAEGKARTPTAAGPAR